MKSDKQIMAEKETVTLKIDGVEVTVEKGKKIYEAAMEAGIYIPGLCFDPKMTRFGGCRMCIVDVSSRGRARAKWACCEPASNGVEVTTTSPKIDKKRQIMMEFLLMYHPLDCPTCNASGDCGLQDAAYYVNQKKGRLPHKRKNEPLLIDNPVLERDYNKCILCGKCVLICDEVQGSTAIDFQGRGFDAEVGTPFRIPLECDFCGQCLHVCPTGSFQDHTEQYKGHDWEYTKTATTCPFCAVGCTLMVNVKNGEIVKITGDDNAGVNKGLMCSRGRFGHGAYRGDDRVKSPLIRVNDQLNPAPWDEAIAAAASQISGVIAASGPESVACLVGENVTNEDAFVIQKVLRTAGVGKLNTLSNLRNEWLNAKLFDEFGSAAPMAKYEDVQDAGSYFFFGCDAEKENPVIANMIRMAARDNKTSVLVANSRNTTFKPHEDQAVRYAYGSETALIAGIIKALLQGDAPVDPKDVADRVENPNDLVASAKKITVAEAAKSAGVTEEQIMALAAALRSGGRPFIAVGAEIHDHPASENIVKGLSNLAALLDGKIMIYRENANTQGVTDMGVTPTHGPGYGSLNGGASSGDIFGAIDAGKVKALIVVGVDPSVYAANASTIKATLGKLEALITTTAYMNDTTAVSTVVLPAATVVERSGSFTNNEGRVSLVRKALDPLGQARADWEIFADLGKALGQPISYGDAGEITAEIAGSVPGYAGLTASKLEWGNGFASYPKGGKGKGFLFDTKNIDTAAGKEYPYLALIGNSLYHLGSLSHKSRALTGIESRSWVEVSYDDAKTLDLFEGDVVKISSAAGTIKAAVRVSDKSPAGTLFIAKNFDANPAMALVETQSAVTRVKIEKA